MKQLFILIASIGILISCSKAPDKAAMEKAKHEILKAEKDFEALVREKGFAEGFSHFAADSVVINRSGRLLHGRDSVFAYYSEDRFSDKIILTWNAQFVDVAASCDLGYTYGDFLYQIPDSLGKINEIRGYFHTVWKKQPDGNWKYVWD